MFAHFPPLCREFWQLVGITACESSSIDRSEKHCADLPIRAKYGLFKGMGIQPTSQERRVCEFFDGREGAAKLEELIFFAERRIRRGGWCIKRADGSIPGGKLAEDVVHTVIEAILRPPGSKGFRRVPDSVPIDVAIRQIVRSYISHALLSAENVTRVDLPETEDGAIFEGGEPFWSTCEIDATDEDRKHAAARCDVFLELAKKRSRDVYNMLVLLRDEGIDKPAVIAKRLNIPVEKVYLARRQLATLILKFGKKEGQK